MSNHTPGPWHVGTPVAGRRFTREDAIEIQSGYKSMVAVLYAQNCSLDGERDRANARLIAAAPDLLEALRKTVAYFADDAGAMDYGELQTAIDDAIEKATGDRPADADAPKDAGVAREGEMITQNETSELAYWQIEKELLELIEERDEFTRDDGSGQGEPTAELAAIDARIAAYVQARVRKVDAIANYLAYCEAMSEAAEARANHFIERAAMWSERMERLRDLTHKAMLDFGLDRVEGETATFKVKKNPPSVHVNNLELIPTDLQKATITMDLELWQRILESLDFEPSIGTVHAQPRIAEIAKLLKQRAPCPDCKGSGLQVVMHATEVCEHCDGEGTVPNSVPGAHLITDKTRLEIR